MTEESKIEQYQATAPSMIEAARNMDLSTPEREAEAEKWFSDARAWCKTAEAELVEPWREQKRHADDQMKKIKATIIDPVLAVVETLRGRIATQRRARQEAAERAARAAQAAIDAQTERDRQAALKAAAKLKTPELREARIEAAQMMVAPVVQVAASAKPTGSKLATVRTWSCVVEDETKIPREYMMPDAVKINRVVKAMKQDANIPGVRVVYTDSVR